MRMVDIEGVDREVFIPTLPHRPRMVFVELDAPIYGGQRLPSPDGSSTMAAASSTRAAVPARARDRPQADRGAAFGVARASLKS